MNLQSLPLYQIAAIIHKDWVNKKGKSSINYAAKPYVEAMGTLGSITDQFIHDSGRDVVARFLCNANSWRGDVAREVKAELKRRLETS